MPIWAMAERRQEINDLAGCQRALCQGNSAANHYWDVKTNSRDRPALFEHMEREAKSCLERLLTSRQSY